MGQPKLSHKRTVTTEQAGDFGLAHGSQLFFKPLFVAQLFVFNFLRAMFYLANPKALKCRADSDVATPNNLCDSHYTFTERYLLIQPLCIIKERPLSHIACVLSSMCKVRNYHKVFDSVIKSISVDVVDVFMWLKVSANVLFHDIAMLKNVTSRVSAWMVGNQDHHVSVSSCRASTLPIVMFWARNISHFVTSLLGLFHRVYGIIKVHWQSSINPTRRESVTSGPAGLPG